ncbi:MAG TPA: type IX secretion system membrane protein PorP/SprF [Chitinophagaceae bacterium]
MQLKRSRLLLFQYGTTAKPQLNINLKLQYQDLVWLGGGYRLQDGFTALIGINLGHTVNVGYSYDYTTNPLRSFSNGSHEFIIGFLLGNQYGDTCPRNVW